MDESIHERLGFFLKENKVNLTLLAKTININRQSLYNYVDGTTSMKIIDLEKILTIYPNLDVVWLFKGEIISPDIQESEETYKKSDKKDCPGCITKERVINSLLDTQGALKRDLHECRRQLQQLNKEPIEKRKVG